MSGVGASRGAHVDLQTHDLPFFAQMGVIFSQTEKFQMDKAAAYPKGFQTGTSALFQVFRQLIHNIKMDGFMLIYTVHDGDGRDIPGLDRTFPLLFTMAS